MQGPTKMSLSMDRWQEFLGYQYLVEHKCCLHSTQGLLATESIPVNEYEYNYSLNKMIQSRSIPHNTIQWDCM